MLGIYPLFFNRRVQLLSGIPQLPFHRTLRRAWDALGTAHLLDVAAAAAGVFCVSCVSVKFDVPRSWFSQFSFWCLVPGLVSSPFGAGVNITQLAHSYGSPKIIHTLIHPGADGN